MNTGYLKNLKAKNLNLKVKNNKTCKSFYRSTVFLSAAIQLNSIAITRLMQLWFLVWWLIRHKCKLISIFSIQNIFFCESIFFDFLLSIFCTCSLCLGSSFVVGKFRIKCIFGWSCDCDGACLGIDFSLLANVQVFSVKIISSVSFLV